jgi:uncharacterized delta-60 repeat protein
MTASRRAAFVVALGVALLSAGANRAVYCQAGCQLDPTFGTSGVVTTSVAPASPRAVRLVAQTDGRIIAAASDTGANTAFVIARYDTNGTLDPTFGVNGLVTTDLGRPAEVRAIYLQADGKLVAAGIVSGPAQFFTQIALARYNTDGTLDAGFGVNGIALTNPVEGSEQALAIAGQPDGKLVVEGASSDTAGILLLRYTADGSLDSGFGVNGRVHSTLDGIQTNVSERGVVVQPDGKIVATGDYVSSTTGPAFEAMVVVRFNADGTPDASFGSAGVAIVGGTPGVFEPSVRALALQPDGRILVAGLDIDHPSFLVARFNGDGSPDTSFGVNGVATTVFFANRLEEADAIALQSDGKIVLAGNTEEQPEMNHPALARFNADGGLDLTFGVSGHIVANFTGGDADFASAVAVQSAGRIVLGGSARFQLALARYSCGTVTPTSTALASSINPSAPGQTVRFTATVTATGSPTGSIVFNDGPITLGTVPLAGNSASLDVSTLSVGAHAITASYSGDVTFASSTSPTLLQVVGGSADTAVTISASTARPRVGQPFMLTVDAHDNGPDAATGVHAQVLLTSNLTLVSSSPAGEYDPATHVWTIGTMAAGATRELQLTATMTGISGAATAFLSADQTDLLPLNNTASVQLQPLGVIAVNTTCTLRSAIIAANTDAPFGGCPAGAPGLDTIVLPTSPLNEYSDVFETPAGIGPNALPAITSPIVIEGNGSIVGRATAAGTPAMRVFFVKKGGALTLHNVTVRNGSGQRGGGILLEGAGASLVVDSSRIVGNSTIEYGGGIAAGLASGADNGAITITNSVFAGNSAGSATSVGAGGAVGAGGVLSITNSTFGPGTANGIGYGGNVATAGGGIYANGPTTIADSIVTQNSAYDGGGIHALSTLSLTNSSVTLNSATVTGGGINAEALTTITGGTISGNTSLNGAGLFTAGRSTLTNVIVSQNVATYGGGIDNRGDLALIGGRVSQNVATAQAGGIINLSNALGAQEKLTLDGTTVSSNVSAGDGGGILTEGPVIVTNSTIGGATALEGNTAAKAGGGILVRNGGSLTMTGGSIARNIARGGWSTDGGGGGIANGGVAPGGTIVLTNVAVTANQTAGGDGAGIFNHGSLRIVGGTVSANVARALAAIGGGSGAGLSNGNTVFVGGPTALVGAAINGNTADAFGGGIQTDGGGPLTLSGATVSGNTSHAAGGGLYVIAGGSASIGDASVIADNVATFSGGGAAVISGTLTMTGGSLLRNIANGTWSAQQGGGAIYNAGPSTASLTDVVVTGNSAPIDGNGGAILNLGTLRVLRGRMSGNHAAASGGAIGNGLTGTPAVLTALTDATLTSNSAATYGGAMFNVGPLTIDRGTIGANQSGFSGGGLMIRQGTARLAGAVFDGNRAADRGGNLYNEGGTLIIDAGAISNGRASSGAGVYTTSTLTMQSGTVVSGNTATGSGGGISAGGGVFIGNDSTSSFEAHIFNVAIRGNHADNGWGGGLYAEGHVIAVTYGTTIDGNTANIGGGIWVSTGASGFINNSAITRNTAPLNGGAGFFTGATVQVLDATISGNTDVSGAGGILSYGATRVGSSTIVDNSGGIVVSDGSLEFSNTVLAGSRTGVDCSFMPATPTATPPVSRGFNVVGSGGGCPVDVTDRTVSPATLFTNVIGPLADNGGGTETHALLAGSPAIDGGDPIPADPSQPTPLPHCSAFDQRGLSRPIDGDGDGLARCDIGAFEQQTPLPVPLSISTITPTSAARGGPTFTLTVNGAGFTTGSTVLWNGSARPTTLVSSMQVTATIPASDLATTRDLTPIAITVTRPDGATATARPFLVVSGNVAAFASGVVGRGTSGTVSDAGGGIIAGTVGGVTATLTNNGAASGAATVTVVTYGSNPTAGTIFAAGGFYDIQVLGADATDTLAAKLYYPVTVTGAAETTLQLLYWNGGTWSPVRSSGGSAPAKDTTNNLDATTSGGRFTVTFDNSSTPRITELTGTVFAMASTASVALEASITFDITKRDLDVRGPAGTSVSVHTTVLRRGQCDRDGWRDRDRIELRTYQLSNTSSTVKLSLLVKRDDDSIEGEVMTLQYGQQRAVIAPRNVLKLGWSSRGQTIQTLEQSFVSGIGRSREEVTAVFDRAKNRTTIRFGTAGPDRVVVKTGLVLLELATDRGSVTVAPLF